MRIHLRSIFDVGVIIIEGEFDWSGADEVRREIYAMALRKRRVIVSLEETPACDGAALNELHLAKRWFGERLMIVIPSEHSAIWLLDVLAWTKALQPLGTLGEALLHCA